jgi:opacity protein-like surface antigen
MVNAMKKIYIIIILNSLFVISLLAQSKVATTAAPFLNIGVTPRASAMGNSFAALANDASALYWNVGGISRINRNEFMVAYTPWLVETDLNWAGLVIALDAENAVGLSVTYLNYGEEEITTVENPDGIQENWDAVDLAVGVSYARNLTDRFSIGGTVKYIQQRIWHSSASSFAMDVGLLFRTYFNDLKIGMSISNFGADMRMEGKDLYRKIDLATDDGGNNPAITTVLKTDPFSLPLLFRVGLGMDVLSFGNSKFTVAADALYPNDNSQSVNFGVEYNWNNNIYLRSGYRSLLRDDANQGFTFGIGLSYSIMSNSNLTVDFSSEQFSVFDNVQKFSLGLTF